MTMLDQPLSHPSSVMPGNSPSYLPTFPSTAIFMVGPAPGLGAGSAGGGNGGTGGAGSSLLWPSQVLGALQCGWGLRGSQPSRKAVG